MTLTDEVASILKGTNGKQSARDYTYEERAVMVIAKCQAHYASLTPEKVREEVLKAMPIVSCEVCCFHKPGNYTRKDCVTYGKRECAADKMYIDQILSLIMGSIVERVREEVAVVEKDDIVVFKPCDCYEVQGQVVNISAPSLGAERMILISWAGEKFERLEHEVQKV